ncbi:MAG: TspO/MBR family protein, partial [Actinomycetota bacterium]
MTVQTRQPITFASKWLALAAFIGVCLAAGVIGTALSGTTQSTWYAELRRPDWAPPAWVFGPVWTTLYAMMGTAAWLVWRELGWGRGGKPLSAFAVQLALNSIWSGIFFGLREPGWAFFELVVLWLAIVVTAS